MKKYLFLLLLIVFLNGCSISPMVEKMPVKLYNLNTGEVIKSSFINDRSGYGKIYGILSNGQKMSGEYSTISGISRTYSSGMGSAIGNRGYTWATADGFSFNQPGKQFGSATLAGGGLVIDIVYAVDPISSHGYGRGRDNKGTKYKVQF